MKKKHIKCPTCLNSIEMSSICPICDSEIEVTFDNNNDWVVVYTTNNIIDAEMFTANIESADIPVHILSQVDTTRMLNVGDLAVVKIYVPYQYIIAAKRIIKSIEDTD